MRETFKKALRENGSGDHVKEFGEAVGIVEGLVDYNPTGGSDPALIGPEFNVRWLPSGLRYGYSAEALTLIVYYEYGEYEHRT